MKPTANTAVRKSRASTRLSAPRSDGSFGTMRSASFDGLRRRRLRPSASTTAETIASSALRMLQLLPYRHAQPDEHDHGDEPRHEPLRHGADLADPPAAAVVGVLRPVDIADDRVELPVADRPLRETRHDVRPDADRLCDLDVGRVLERRWERSRHDAPLRDDLMAAGAVFREELKSLRQVPLLRVRRRDGRALAERGDVGDERADLTLREQHARTARLEADLVQRHVAGAKVEVGGERADAAQRRGNRLLLLLIALLRCADRARRGCAFAVGPVAREAVLTVQRIALPHEPAGLRRDADEEE